MFVSSALFRAFLGFLTIAATVVAGIALPITALALVSPQTVNITVNCLEDVSFQANVGDTLVITMVHPTCDGSSSSDGGNYANLNNLNGSYFTTALYDTDEDPLTPDVMPYQGTATGAGFLEYVSHTQATNKSFDYWHLPENGLQDDWYVMQTEDAPNVVITATLRLIDGAGNTLQIGSTVGDIYTESAYFEPTEFALKWAGPRSGITQDTATTLPSNQKLFADIYELNKVGRVDFNSSTVVPFGQEMVPEAATAEGAGYDPVTKKTWVMQDCELFELHADGSSSSARFTVPELSGTPLSLCWAFTTIGDGTAYLHGRLNSVDADSWKIFRISLSTGELLDGGLDLSLDSNSVDPISGEVLTKSSLELWDLSYNPNNHQLWALGNNYIYTIDVGSGAVSNVYANFVDQGEGPWSIAVDSNNVLWVQMDGGGLSALAPDNGWSRFDSPVFQIENSEVSFYSAAMWIETQENTSPLAATGNSVSGIAGISAFIMLLGVGLMSLRKFCPSKSS